jgi:hypothetical protein
MICPNCKCEYVRGVTQCADCGVPLVDALDPSAPHTANGEEVVSVWEGNDRGESSAVKAALEKAGIPVIDQEAAGYFIFPSMRPRTEIFVSRENLEQAKKVLFDADALMDPEAMTDEERDSLALPESDLPDPDNDEQTSVAEDSSADWGEDETVAEVWTGDSEDLADTLIACLREIGVSSRKTAEAAHWHLVVRPEHETRAREIVREVVEASPPE